MTAEELFKQGLELTGQKKWNEAIEVYTHLIEECPDYPELGFVYFHRGRTYQGKEDFALAEKDFNEAVRLDPQNLTLLRELGIFYQRIKKISRSDRSV